MIRIAPLLPSERARWAELWSEYQRFYQVELGPAVTEALWERLHNGRVHGLGAHDSSGHLIGIVHFLYHEDTWSTVPACYLEDLYVDSAIRGTGCGRLLIEAVADAAKKAGANNPYWLTQETNQVARRLYDRLAQKPGFIQYIYSAIVDPDAS